ncbi:MAG: nicotinamide-nucleotide amidohydrolase family protein [Planctomycetaceae bacterium]|nr:nicotinamide-nucleotide amidohydrolase family protein [Planctomycetaceae bacterium]
MDDPAFAAAQLVAQQLGARRMRLVLAESCTGGLVAATLARIPGISGWLCGSAVVYRLDTKQQWLGVPTELFHPPGPGVVSREVAEAMARGVLSRTPEAQVAAAITGHLGPNAPADQDGLIWMCVAMQRDDGPSITTASHCLNGDLEPPLSLRETRQRTAARCLLALIDEALSRLPS